MVPCTRCLHFRQRWFKYWNGCPRMQIFTQILCMRDVCTTSGVIDQKSHSPYLFEKLENGLKTAKNQYFAHVSVIFLLLFFFFFLKEKYLTWKMFRIKCPATMFSHVFWNKMWFVCLRTLEIKEFQNRRLFGTKIIAYNIHRDYPVITYWKSHPSTQLEKERGGLKP